MHCGLYAVHVRSPSARPPRTLTRMGLTARTSGVPRAREETGTSEDANTMCIASRSSKLSLKLVVQRYLAQRRTRSELWQMQCAAIHDPASPTRSRSRGGRPCDCAPASIAICIAATCRHHRVTLRVRCARASVQWMAYSSYSHREWLPSIARALPAGYMASRDLHHASGDAVNSALKRHEAEANTSGSLITRSTRI